LSLGVLVGGTSAVFVLGRELNLIEVFMFVSCFVRRVVHQMTTFVTFVPSGTGLSPICPFRAWKGPGRGSAKLPVFLVLLSSTMNEFTFCVTQPRQPGPYQLPVGAPD
jgi:hypothetical protein